MRMAMANAEVGDDVLEGDPTVRQLETEVARLLGKDAALYFPSGTMANQTAIWMHAEPGTEVLCDARAHIYDWEGAGASVFRGAQLRTVTPASARRMSSAVCVPPRATPLAPRCCAWRIRTTVPVVRSHRWLTCRRLVMRAAPRG